MEEYAPSFVFPRVNKMVKCVVECTYYTHVLVRLLETDGLPTLGVQAVINREDCMFGIKDEHRLSDLFSPGDTVIARVLSLGHTGHVVLSTADPAHGVIKAVEYSTLREIRLQSGAFRGSDGKPLPRKTAQGGE